MDPIAAFVGDPMPFDNARGLLLMGGTDVNPKRYGEAPRPETDPPDDERDQVELDLIHAALERDLPILAICRGLQILNVYHGGTLTQHLGAIKHDPGKTTIPARRTKFNFYQAAGWRRLQAPPAGRSIRVIIRRSPKLETISTSRLGIRKMEWWKGSSGAINGSLWRCNGIRRIRSSDTRSNFGYFRALRPRFDEHRVHWRKATGGRRKRLPHRFKHSGTGAFACLLSLAGEFDQH